MNNTIKGEEFDPSQNYSLTIVVLMIAMLYSPGMPILFILAFFQFLIAYFSEKYLIINLYSKGQYINEKMSVG